MRSQVVGVGGAREGTFIRLRGVLGKAAGSSVNCPSYRRRSIGVAQHGMEGAGKVVGVVAAVVLLRHGHQAGQADQEQEQQLDGERGPEDTQQEGGLALGWGGGGGGGGQAVCEVRTGGSAASGP